MSITTDARDDYIRQVVGGRTFCDVGGLWGTVKEKVSVALTAGAEEATMLDITAEGGVLWERFSDRMRGMGLQARCVQGSVDDPAIVEQAGTFDVVHCSGVLYHCPNPLHTLHQLLRLTRRHLVVTSIIVPETIETESGAMSVPAGHSLFLPGLSDRERTILAEHFHGLGITHMGGIDPPVRRWSVEDYGPWWWLFPVSTMRSMLQACGWSVVADAPVWHGRSHGFLAAADET